MAFITANHGIDAYSLILQLMMLIILPLLRIPMNMASKFIDVTLGTTHGIIQNTTKTVINFLTHHLPETNSTKQNKSLRTEARKRERILRTMAMATLSSTMKFALPTSLGTAPSIVRINAESHKVGVNNRASKCISKHRGDFVDELRKQELTIQGYTGPTRSTLQIGTIRW